MNPDGGTINPKSFECGTSGGQPRLLKRLDRNIMGITLIGWWRLSRFIETGLSQTECFAIQKKSPALG
jgi:hypothetical protein